MHLEPDYFPAKALIAPSRSSPLAALPSLSSRETAPQSLSSVPAALAGFCFLFHLLIPSLALHPDSCLSVRLGYVLLCSRLVGILLAVSVVPFMLLRDTESSGAFGLEWWWHRNSNRVDTIISDKGNSICLCHPYRDFIMLAVGIE